jgi:biopolymer transport protein ExbD
MYKLRLEPLRANALEGDPMPTQPIHPLQSKYFVVILTCTLAITRFAAPVIAQQLHEGVSVQMATTTNAKPMPAADDEDARVIAVTADARFYFGTRRLTAEGLSGQMKTTPRRRDQNLYIKADAHAPFASIEKVFDAARVGFNTAVLLTSQPEPVASRKIVPPKGFTVSLGPRVGRWRRSCARAERR